MLKNRLIVLTALIASTVSALGEGCQGFESHRRTIPKV